MLREMQQLKPLWEWSKAHCLLLASIVLLILLAAKFFYPVFAFDLPLGYDPGMYRYLFIKYADAWPPFVLPELRPWAQEYPYGIFIFSSMLMKVGVPVDWFMGWLWSAMAVLLIGTLGWIMSKREGREVGILVLLFGLLSLAFFDGFAAMYWKTFFAMFFLILTFHFFDKKSPWMIIFGALTILSHNQTGLILALAIAGWWFLRLPVRWREPSFRKLTVAFALIALLGLAWYAPIWFRAFWAPFKSVLLLRGEDAPGGGFPETMFYVRHGWVLLVFGVGGFVWSFRKERFSVWQLAVLVCAAFVLFKLVFYRRFFLQLDFFLIPFAAVALRDAWVRWREIVLRTVLCSLLLWQVYASYPQMMRWKPGFRTDVLRSIQSIPQYVEENATVIALDNISAVWLLGWLPQYFTGGPGLFDFPKWKYEDWETFLYGTDEERKEMLKAIKKRPIYFMTSPLFYRHYGDFIKGFLADPCFVHIEGAPLMKVVCDSEQQ